MKPNSRTRPQRGPRTRRIDTETPVPAVTRLGVENPNGKGGPEGEVAQSVVCDARHVGCVGAGAFERAPTDAGV